MIRGNFFPVRNRVLVLGLTCTVLGLGRWIYTWDRGAGSCLPDTWTFTSFLMAVIFLDMYHFKPASHHTIVSLCLQYVFHRLLRTLGTIVKLQFIKQCKACTYTQEQLLINILKQNKETIFCKDFGLDQIHSVEDFRRRMPLTTYTDYSKYVDMVTESGSENVLFPGKASFVALTSGTTSGKSKAYLKSLNSKRRTMFALMMVLDTNTRLGIDLLMKMAFLRVSPKLSKTKSGIDSGPITSLMAPTLPFVTVDLYNTFGEFEALYIQLLFAIREDDLVYLASQISTTVLTAFKILENNWEALCNDIENGRIPESLDVPENERKRLNKLLKPYPERAEFLRKEFAKGFKNIVARIWPSCPCLVAIKTGMFESVGKAVEEQYLGKLPCVTVFHNGTETFYGTNIYPMRETVSFAPYININFFELIPEEEVGKDDPCTLLAHQVEIGKTYELVITTYDGLYRYRTEDLVQITEFFHTTPLYKFVRRAGDILSVGTDKVPEFLLYEAVNEAAVQWKDRVVEFTSCESIHVNKILGIQDNFQHYCVLIETESTDKLTKDKETMVDEGLCQRHDVYAAMRKNKKLQQLQFIQLKPGAFLNLKCKMLELNPSSFCMQIKTPRILRRESLLEIVLDERL